MRNRDRNMHKLHLEIRLYVIFGILAALAYVVVGWLGVRVYVQVIAALATFFGGIALYVAVSIAYSIVVGKAILKSVEAAGRHQSTIEKVIGRILDIPEKMIDKWLATSNAGSEPQSTNPDNSRASKPDDRVSE